MHPLSVARLVAGLEFVAACSDLISSLRYDKYNINT
jgi:hypothetical protein